MKLGFLALIILFSLTNAFAKNTADIISGGTSTSLVFTKYTNSYEANFSGNVGYAHAFDNGLQLGSNGAFSIQSSFKSLLLTVGPTYNFKANDLENSFFAGLQAGVITYFYSGSNTTNGVVAIEGGKHFKLIEGVTYSPSINVKKILGAYSPDPTISFNIFKFSIFF